MSTLRLFSYLCIGMLFATAMPHPGIAKAAEDTQNLPVCPIEAEPSAVFVEDEEEIYIEDELFGRATIFNNSTFTMGGVKVGVAIYDQTQTLQYWTVLGEELQLFPQTSLEVPLELDATGLGVGKYIAKVFAVQGDETVMLGKMIRDAAVTEGSVSLRKAGVGSNKVLLSMEIGESKSHGQKVVLGSADPITIKVITENKNDLPLMESSMLVAVTEGSIPLGSAVRGEKRGIVQLIPKDWQSTILKDVAIGPGQHTAYAALLTKSVLQPVLAVPIDIPGETTKSWSYISRVGLSTYPLLSGSEVVACVDVIGKSLNESPFAELLGVALGVVSDGRNIASTTLYSTEVATWNYFVLPLSQEVSDFVLTADLLQQRFYSPYIESETYTVEQATKDSLAVVDRLQATFSCNSSEGCAPVIFVMPTGEDNDQYPFWFYAGIVIAALLLLFLMLRRLSTTDSVSVQPNNQLSPDELQ